jgi:hypothetical protein
MLNIIKDFFCFYWHDHVIFALDSFYMFDYMYLFTYVEHPCFPAMKLT